MRMLFSTDEVKSILKNHVIEKLGVDRQAVGIVEVRFVENTEYFEAHVYISTEKETAVPLGSYRTKIK